MSKETWEEGCERQRQACGDPTPWELTATGLRIPGPPKTRMKEWRYSPRKLSDNVTRIHPAPSIPNPLMTNPWEELSDRDIEEGIFAAQVRIDGAQHTIASLTRERERRAQDQRQEKP